MKLNIHEIYNDDPPKKKVGGHKASSGKSGIPVPLTIMGIGLMIAAVFLGLQSVNSYSLVPVYAAGGAELRATNAAYQQGLAVYEMTSRAAQDAQATQAVIQQQQAATQAVYIQQATQAAATAWSLTQTPLAEEAIERQLRIKRMQDEAYWSGYVTPFRVLGWAAFVSVVLIALAVLMVLYAWKTLPVWHARMQVVTEERGQRTIIVRPNETINTSLMFEPVIKHMPDGTIETGGGAKDPLLQARLTHDQAQVDMMRALPPGARLPGLRPDTAKALPELEIIDAQAKEITPALVADIRQSLDGEEA